MKSCWRPFQEDRPTFTDLRQHLENILQQDTPYLELDIDSMDMGIIEEERSSGSDSFSSDSSIEMTTAGNNNEEVKIVVDSSSCEEGDHLSNHGDRGDATKSEETSPMLIM